MINIDKIENIELRCIDEIKEYDKNPRKNNKAVEKVAKSISLYGFQQPIVCDKDGVIVVGHTRYKAAKSLGMMKVPCIQARKNGRWLSQSECKAYRIADNKTNEYASWDDDLLKMELKDLKIEMPDIDLSDATGMSDGEIRKSIDEESVDAEPQISKAEELQKVWDVQRGDLWRIGEHLLMCGNSTSADDVARIMNGKNADMVFTDPPYGVSIGNKNKMLNTFQKVNTFQKAGRCLENIENDNMKSEELYTILLAAFKLTYDVMADHASIYLTAPQGGGLSMMMMVMMKNAGLEIKHILNWVKSSPTFSMGRLDYDYKHEPILYTWKKKHVFYGGGKYKSSCWDIDKPRKCAEHPTMKPVELYENGILNSSDNGMLIYEPFAGSGTAFVAAQNTNRICHGMEISPAYCAVILERMKTAFPDIKIEKQKGSAK